MGIERSGRIVCERHISDRILGIIQQDGQLTMDNLPFVLGIAEVFSRLAEDDLSPEHAASLKMATYRTRISEEVGWFSGIGVRVCGKIMTAGHVLDPSTLPTQLVDYQGVARRIDRVSRHESIDLGDMYSSSLGSGPELPLRDSRYLRAGYRLHVQVIRNQFQGADVVGGVYVGRALQISPNQRLSQATLDNAFYVKFPDEALVNGQSGSAVVNSYGEFVGTLVGAMKLPLRGLDGYTKIGVVVQSERIKDFLS